MPKTSREVWERKFHERIHRTDNPDDCWEWTGTGRVDGYGQVTWEHRKYGCHRVAWELAFGDIPEGMNVLHKCDNPPCCNPAHLFLGTAEDNNRDRSMKGRTVSRPGELHHGAKLTQSDVIEIRRLAAAGVSVGELMTRFPVKRAQMYRVIKADRWQHLVHPTNHP